MEQSHAMGNVEPKPPSLASGTSRISAIVPFNEVSQLFFFHTWTVVGHVQHEVVVALSLQEHG